MKTEIFHSKSLENMLKIKKICTINELMSALGTTARKTIFRKLSELKYQTSYSHCGKYYALKSTCKFNDRGLWLFKNACFSVHGTLLETVKEFIDSSMSGYSVEELDSLLHVSSRLALLTLDNRELVVRQKFSGVYVYFSVNDELRGQQIESRKSELFPKKHTTGTNVLAHELKAAIILFFSLLDERQRRLFAGIEAMKLGTGGDTHIAELLGIDPHTVSKGRNELLNRDVDLGRLRRSGAGRKRLEKKLQK